MNLFEILKQFKNIEPDPLFTEKSKRMIFAAPQRMAAGMRAGVLRFLETGVALVLAGFFILLITGGFAGEQSLAPLQYSVIDPQGLKAEADAIDIQIKLANVNYAEVSSATTTPAAVSTPSVAASSETLAPSLMAAATSSATSSAGTGAPASSTASSTLSIDQALEGLSQ